MKSPCVKDCPDRLPCGACRKTCEAFRAYEIQRLQKKNVGRPSEHLRAGTVCAAEREIRKGWKTAYEIDRKGRQHE